MCADCLGTRCAEPECYGDCDADEHYRFDCCWVPSDDCDHHCRVAIFTSERIYGRNNNTNFPLLYFLPRDSNPNHKNNHTITITNTIDTNPHQPQRSSPPNLAHHHHHHPTSNTLLPNRLLRLLGRPRRRLLPDRPRLPDHLLPAHGVHDHHHHQHHLRRRRDGRCAADGRSLLCFYFCQQLCGWLVVVSHGRGRGRGRGGGCWVLSGWV